MTLRISDLGRASFSYGAELFNKQLLRNQDGQLRRGVVRVDQARVLPGFVYADQVPVISSSMTDEQWSTLGSFQEAVARVRCINHDNREVGSGSAFSVNSSGIFVSCEHVLDKSTGASFSDILRHLFFSGLLDSGRFKFLVDLPCVDPDDNSGYGIKIKTFNVEILDFDEEKDIGLFKAVVDGMDEFPFLTFSKNELKAGSKVLKIGHLGGTEYNQLSCGEVEEQTRLLGIKGIFDRCDIPVVRTTAPLSRGDSGSVFISEDGGVCAMPIAVKYVEDDSHQRVGDMYSYGVTSTATIVPYLEKILPNRCYHNIIDGNRTYVDHRDIRRSSGSPTVVVVAIDLPEV